MNGYKNYDSQNTFTNGILVPTQILQALAHPVVKQQKFNMNGRK